MADLRASLPFDPRDPVGQQWLDLTRPATGAAVQTDVTIAALAGGIVGHGLLEIACGVKTDLAVARDVSLALALRDVSAISLELYLCAVTDLDGPDRAASAELLSHFETLWRRSIERQFTGLVLYSDAATLSCRGVFASAQRHIAAGRPVFILAQGEV